VWLMNVAVRTQATPACVHCSSLRPPPSTTGLLCQRNMRIREGDYAMCFPKQRTWTVSLESAGPLAERGLGWAGRFALCVPASAFSESWAAPFVNRHAGEVRPDAGTGWNGYTYGGVLCQQSWRSFIHQTGPASPLPWISWPRESVTSTVDRQTALAETPGRPRRTHQQRRQTAS
jgi:hypothetical protein